MADTLASGLFISEILADNAGASAFDTDGDGNITKADEYVEIQNASGTPVSLDGVQIWSQTNGLLYTFGPGDTIAPGETATLLGEYTGTRPAGFYESGIPNNGNFLPDGEASRFDTIFLLDTNTGTYITLSYGEPPQPATPPSGFPSGATQLGSGESIDSGAPNGKAITRDANGDLVESDPTPGQPDVLCLLAGTRIATLDGPVAIEKLTPGRRIPCADGRTRILRAVGHTTLSADLLERLPQLAPVILPAGRLGNAVPLALSPNHRVLIESPDAHMMFGTPGVLIPAKSMAHKRHRGRADLFHLLFDDHCLIRAGGAWVESLYLGDVGRRWLETQRAIGALIEQDCGRSDAISHSALAQPALRDYEARVLLAAGIVPSARVRARVI